MIGNSAQTDHLFPEYTDHLIPGGCDHPIPEYTDHLFLSISCCSVFKFFRLFNPEKFMANNLISMSKLRQILKMHCEGHSKQSIATLHRTSRNTVRRHIKQFECLKITVNDLANLSDKELDALFRNEVPFVPATRLEQLYKYFPEVDKQLKRRGMTLLKLWHEYIEQYPDGYQQTSYYYHYGLWKKRSHPSMRIEHKAGDKMFVDFAGE